MTGAWKLAYSGVSQTFGDGGIYFREFPLPGTPETEDQDGTYPSDDGGTVGEDLHGSVTIACQLGVDGWSELETRDNWDRLRGVWSGDEIRRRTGAVAELTSDRGRSAIGRPRKIAPTRSYLHETPPRMDLEAEYLAVDELWYGPWQSQRVGLGARGSSGIRFPIVFPMVSTPPSQRDDLFVVGGTKPTWFVGVIEGPISSPDLRVDNRLRFAFPGLTLAFDQSVTIDTRPWARSVLRNDGVSLAGVMDPTSTLLSQGRITPGQHLLTIRGVSATGSAHGVARWRDAFATP